MNVARARRGVLALACTCLLVTAALAEKSPAKTLWIRTPVIVAADGTVSIGKLNGVEGELEAHARQWIGRHRFVPVMVGSQRKAAESELTAVLSLTPNGGNYDAKLERLFLAPAIKSLQPPRYPTRMVRLHKSGYAEIRVEISPQGRVTRVISAMATDPEFERAAAAVMEKAEFNAVRIEGVPIAVEVSVPVLFRIENQPLPPYSATCELDRRQPIAEGQDGCIAPIEVSAWRK